MKVLDNPAWSALTTAQSSFAQGTTGAKRYRPGVLPFVGFMPGRPGVELDPFIAMGESFYIIGGLPVLPENWTVELELPCAQLIAPEDPCGLPAAREEMLLLGEADKEEMFQLINAVQPGYYLPDTRQIGEYFGIRDGTGEKYHPEPNHQRLAFGRSAGGAPGGIRDGTGSPGGIRQEGRLVAMAGERMRMTGFSELSAVCTLPGYTGLGYAQRLISLLCRQQVAAGITPFLHVAKANQRALGLYEHLGFRHRRDISFWRVKKG